MPITLAGGALNQTPLDWENNQRNILSAIKVAKERKADLLLLPELCITGYGCEDMFLSPWVIEKALCQLLEIVPHASNICLALGLPMQVEEKLYNAVCLIHDGRIYGFYAKQSLAMDGVHYETRWFHPWSAGKTATVLVGGKEYLFGDQVFDLPKGIRLGFEICEDAWRPNRPAIRYAQQGVNLILNPSASHFAFAKTKLREEVVAVKASEKFNCVYMYANLLGNEAGRIVYDGEVMIAQHGKLVQKNNLLSFADLDVAIGTVNLEGGANEEIYSLEYANQSKEEEFAAALTLALFDYCRKSRSNGFVLSLSGGADSCLCAVAVAEMIKRGVAELGVEVFLKKLNAQNRFDLDKLKALPQPEACKLITAQLLICAYQSSVNSSEDTLQSAKKLAESLGATFYHWSIDDEVKGYTQKIEQNIGRQFTWKTDDITLQNIQARVRAPAIWMLANLTNSLLLATSNRSEASVGYATMDGDTAGSISPIAGIDKNFVRQWLRWAETALGYSGLQYVNSLQPTAELRPGDRHQTDEEDLMPYSVLQTIERAAFLEKLSPIQIFEKYNHLEEANLFAAHLKKFFRLWSRNQWKRERYAPSFHFDDYNVDPRSWLRFPILSGSYQQELAELDKLVPKEHI